MTTTIATSDMPSRSTTFGLLTEGTGSEVEPRMFEVDYGSGSVLGMEGVDNVSLAGLALSEVRFGLVLYEDQQVSRLLLLWSWRCVVGFGCRWCRLVDEVADWRASSSRDLLLVRSLGTTARDPRHNPAAGRREDTHDFVRTFDRTRSILFCKQSYQHHLVYSIRLCLRQCHHLSFF